MNIIRAGVFETNSSSTHTCVLTRKSTYYAWCKGELVYDYNSSDSGTTTKLRDLVKKYSDEEYLVGEDFVNVKALYDIPFSALYETDKYLLPKYDKRSEKYTLGQIWDLFRLFDFNSIELENTDFEKEFKRATEDYPELPEIQSIINVIAGFTRYGDEGVNFYCWNYLFRCFLGIYTADNLRDPLMEQEEITERTFGDEDIVAFCTYGHD